MHRQGDCSVTSSIDTVRQNVATWAALTVDHVKVFEAFRCLIFI
jgi:hypothetical protein